MIFELDLDIVKVYSYTQNELFYTSNHPKVYLYVNTHIYTRRRNWKYCFPAYAVSDKQVIVRISLERRTCYSASLEGRVAHCKSRSTWIAQLRSQKEMVLTTWTCRVLLRDHLPHPVRVLPSLHPLTPPISRYVRTLGTGSHYLKALRYLQISCNNLKTLHLFIVKLTLGDRLSVQS